MAPRRVAVGHGHHAVLAHLVWVWVGQCPGPVPSVPCLQALVSVRPLVCFATPGGDTGTLFSFRVQEGIGEGRERGSERVGRGDRRG